MLWGPPALAPLPPPPAIAAAPPPPSTARPEGSTSIAAPAAVVSGLSGELSLLPTASAADEAAAVEEEESEEDPAAVGEAALETLGQVDRYAATASTAELRMPIISKRRSS